MEQDPPDRETGSLVSSASNGDAGAVAALLERFLPDLERYVARHRGAELAQKESTSDLVQSVCRELIERLADQRFEYRGEAEFRKWLYNAATMKLGARRRFWRAERRDARRQAPPGGSPSSAAAPEPFVSEATPSERAELWDELDRLRRAMAQLSERDREIVVLAQVDRLSHREIAERLGITESNSRVLLSRALARLATLGARQA